MIYELNYNFVTYIFLMFHFNRCIFVNNKFWQNLFHSVNLESTFEKIIIKHIRGSSHAAFHNILLLLQNFIGTQLHFTF